MMGVVSIMILASLTPTMQQMMDQNRDSETFNCKSYVDSDVTLSYNSSLDTNDFGCAVSSFGIGFFVIAVLVGIVMFSMSGGPAPEEYNPYAQY